MTSRAYWNQDWTALKLKDRRHILEFLEELAGIVGYKVVLRKNFTSASDPRYNDESGNITAGAFLSFDRRVILLFTHMKTQKRGLKPFKLSEFLSNFFHELGHAVGEELGSFYERSQSANTKRTWLEAYPETMLDSVYQYIGGETLAEIRGKLLAESFLPGMPFKYSYQMRTFELTLPILGLDSVLFDENAEWDFSEFKGIPEDEPVPVKGEAEIFGE